MIEPLAIGVEVLKRRRLRRWSQAELAVRSGVGVATVVRVERGATMPDTTTLLRLAEALGVPVSELVPTSTGPGEPLERRSA